MTDDAQLDRGHDVVASLGVCVLALQRAIAQAIASQAIAAQAIAADRIAAHGLVGARFAVGSQACRQQGRSLAGSVCSLAGECAWQRAWQRAGARDGCQGIAAVAVVSIGGGIAGIAWQ